MSQIVKKFIGNNQVGAAKIQLENNAALKGRNAANSADVDIVKINASDEIETQGSLIPSVDAAQTLGKAGKGFSDAYMGLIKRSADDSAVLDINTRTLSDSAGNGAIDFQNRTLADNTSVNSMDFNARRLINSAGNQVLDFSNAVAIRSPDAGTTAGQLIMEDADGAESITIQSPDSLTASYSLILPPNDGSSGQVLQTDGSGTLSWASAGGSGTVTTVSVVSANGLAGSVANATTTPALTLSTTVTGVLKGNGTAISAAVAGTDYSDGTSALATGILKSTTGTGVLSIAIAADFPTLNQNTTGTAANVTGVVAIANGGTGQTTASAGFNALSPMTTLGDIIYGGASGTGTRLGIGSAGQVLTVVSGSPAWAAAGASSTPNKETFVLSGTDITNQYIDLAQVASTGSILFQVKGAGALLEGASYDYSVSYTGGAGGNTRITFLNDLATGGGAALVATDVVQVNYIY